MRTLCATLVLLFTILMALTAAPTGAKTATAAYGPTFPPDPWSKVAYGPTFPPDPWSRIHYGPTFPPDPWSR